MSVDLIVLTQAAAGPSLQRVRPAPLPHVLGIGWEDQAPVATVTASDQVSGLPATNVQGGSRTRLWRSATAPAVLTATWPVDIVIGAVVLQATNLSRAGRATVRVAGAEGVYGAPIAMSLDPATGHLLGLCDVIGRSIRIELVDPTLTYVEAGRLWVSALYRPRRNFAFGAAWGVVDVSGRAETWGGQVYVDRRPVRRTVSLPLEALDDLDASEQLRAALTVGSSRDVLVITNPGSPCPARDMLIGLPTEPWRVTRPDVGRWTSSISIVEKL